MEGRNFGKFLRLFVLLALTAALVFAVGTLAFSQETQNEPDKECYMSGDMNADGVLTSADAIYALYNYVYGDESYHIGQDTDINGDGELTSADAIELLYAFYGWTNAKTEHIGTVVHDYYDPAWTWTETNGEVAVQVTLQCACGEPVTLDVEDVSLDAEACTVATCAATGRNVYNARVEYAGMVLTSSYTQILSALPHQPGDMVTSDAAQHYALCTVCDEKLNAANHVWETDGDIVKGDCQTQSTQHYTCACGAEKTEQLGVEAHTYVYDQDVLDDASNCTYAKQYRCTVCEDTYKADQYTNHNYKTVVTQEATCQQAGQKASKCADCGDVRSTEEIPANNHVWVEGEVVSGVRTDTCSACATTKTTAVASGSVSNDVLQNSDELSVGDTTMSMDDTVKENLDADREIVITVDQIDKTEVDIEGELTQEQLNQIVGDVYDFNMTYDDGEKVDFDGKITISLPYELGEDEDIDSIDVWYIADNGELVLCEATYNNGYITFEVSHFSYYTVTRLTPRERCERYGHFWTDSNKTATCTTDGYTSQVCQRCNAVQNKVEIPATGHNYDGAERVTTEATCTTFGSVSYKCTVCTYVNAEVLPALGHDVQSTTTDATCDAPGKISHTCSRCDAYAREEVLPQLTHEYERDEARDVAPTCTTGGYEIHVCKHCGQEQKKNEQPAKGHNHPKENAQWDWDDAEKDPLLVVTCSNGCGNTKELKPNVVETEGSCGVEGTTTATVYYNGTKFEKSHGKGDAKDHEFGNKWHTTEENHYHRCDRCGAQEDVAAHSFGDGVVTAQPTCAADGVMTYTCECGYAYEEVIPATGVHSMDAGVVTRKPSCTANGVKIYTCTVCGYAEKEVLIATGHNFENDVCTACGKINGCDHTEFNATKIELPDGVCRGRDLYLISCTCGDQQSVTMHSLECKLVWEEIYDETTGYYKQQQRCVECGLTFEMQIDVEHSTEPCIQKVTTNVVVVFDGVVLTEFVEYYENAHPIFWGETEVLTDLGMCDLYVEYGSCPCGKLQVTNCYEECEWENWTCTKCGVYRERVREEETIEGCQVYGAYTYIYIDQDGNELYRYTKNTMYDRHDEYVADSFLLGETCEDGYVLVHGCNNCDYSGFGFGWGHDTYLQETYDLSEYGMCSGQYYQHGCACGQNSSFWGNEDCEWAHTGYVEGEGERFVCTKCGAVRLENEERYWESDCIQHVEYKITFFDTLGNPLFEVVDRWRNEEHNNYLESVVMYGETCEDGVYATYKCAVCGDSYAQEYYDHRTQVTSTYFGEEYGICGLTIYVDGCLCGEVSHHTWAETNCSYVIDESYEDGERYYCEVCGSEYICRGSRVEESQCVYWEAWDHYYFNAAGEKIYHWTEATQINTHAYTITYKLYGETCDEGVEKTYTCTICGDSFTETYYWHRQDRQYYELSEYGLCGGWLEVSSCACGQDSWHESDFWCNFQIVEKGDGTQTRYCAECDTYLYATYTEETISECITAYDYQCVLSNATMGETTLIFGNEVWHHDHKWIYELTLMEGATSCEDGFIVSESCARCGESWGEWEEYGHCTYTVERELISEGVLCGDVELLTFRCACGQENDTEYRVSGCDYNYNGYDEALGCDTYLCAGCGTIRYATTVTVPVEGIDCQKERITTYTYLRDGEVVLAYEKSYISTNHKFIAQLTLLEGATTCDGGYTVYNVCAYCDYGYEAGTFYGCENYRIWTQQGVSAEDGFCGDIGLNIHGCACGKNAHWSWYNNCSFNHIGWDEVTGNAVYQCANCGLMYTEQDVAERMDEACKETITRTMTFMVYNGEERVTVSVVESTITRKCHTNLYEFEMNGQTCDDGYTVYRICKYCDYREEWSTGTGCMTWQVDVEKVLSDDAYCTVAYQHTYSCPCGKQTTHGVSRQTNCNFEWVYNETLGREVDCCSDCGLIVIEEHFSEVIDPAQPCFRMNGWRYNYYKEDGTLICSLVSDGRNEQHTYLHTFEMLGETCDDGYQVYRTCMYCGYGEEHGTYYGCQNWLVSMETKLDNEAYCTKVYQYNYDCPCGAYGQSDSVWNDNHCSFETVYNEEMDRWIETCSECGLTYFSEWFREVIDPEVPCYTMDGERYTYLDNDGNELCTVIDNWRNENHTYIHTFEKLGTTCDDGYYVYRNCVHCGATSDYGVYYGCNQWLVNVETVMRDDAYCSAVYRYYYDCACGGKADSNIARSGDCTFEWQYVEALDRHVNICTKCGLYFADEYFREVIDPAEPCFWMEGWRYTYYAADGTVLCVVDDGSRSEYHNWLHSFELLGDTCDDGYYVIRNCVECGYSNRDEMVSTECVIHRVRTETVLAGDKYGYCSDVLQHYNSCACGAHTSASYSMPSECSFVWVYNDTLQKHVCECSNCGLIYHSEQVRQVIDPEKPCYYMSGTRYNFYDADGNWLCAAESTSESEGHTYLASFQMHGTTCDEGYTVYYDCLYCDRSDETKSSGCMTYRTARYDLTAYGLCGGYVDYSNCPCGKTSTVDWDIACNYTWLDELEKGNQYRYCADCNTKFCFGNWAETKYEECALVATYFLKAYRDDVMVADVQWQTRRDEHTYLMVGYEGDCESSVTAFMKCKYCGKEKTNYGYGGHYTFMTGFIDLGAAGACGGYAQKYQCACGKYESYDVYNTYNCSFSYSDEQEIQPDGNILYKQTRTCSKCGLEIYEQWTTTRDAATCQQTTVRSIWLYMNGEELGTFTEREINESHNYGETIWELENPAGTCEDGLDGIRTCADCGATETWWTSGHTYNVVESIDLSQYGSVCGCYLKHYRCPCGKYQNYQIGGECDLDQEWTDMWIEGALYEGQYTTAGWNWFDYYSHTYTCAVTNPQCGLKVRMAEYWLQEGCEAVRYQTWQLGCVYDETTGQWTWDREITIATGERSTFHDYEYTETTETESDGNYVTTRSYVCTACASSYVEKNQYKNWSHVGSERTAINLLDNGEMKQRTEIWVDGFEHNGNHYRTYEKNMYIRADGTEYWSEYTYEYLMEGQCKQVVTHKDSNGSFNTYEYEHPVFYHNWEWIEEPTCSQSGAEKEFHTCAFCEQVIYEYTHEREPYGHSWYMHPDTGVYECSRCGLENSNGADGTIIMEDLTAQYGNNTNYVVGYWNQGNGEFTAYASVILVDGTDEYNEIILTGIEFSYLTEEKDGVRALVADQAAIQEAAAAAMLEAGYTGTFAIRITFVPVDGDGLLDYGITFDSQTAEGGAQ